MPLQVIAVNVRNSAYRVRQVIIHALESSDLTPMLISFLSFVPYVYGALCRVVHRVTRSRQPPPRRAPAERPHRIALGPPSFRRESLPHMRADAYHEPQRLKVHSRINQRHQERHIPLILSSSQDPPTTKAKAGDPKTLEPPFTA